MSIRLAPRHVNALRARARKTDLSEAEIIRRLIDLEFGLRGAIAPKGPRR